MKGKRAICCILLLVSLTATGCWDRTEVNDLALVMATALDEAEDGKVRVTVQIAIPSGGGLGAGGVPGGGGGQKNSFFLETAVGRDLHDAQQKIQEKLSRRLYIAHRRIVIIGERLAKKGIKNLLDRFARDPTSRLRSYILVAKGREASKLLELVHPIERIPAEAVRELEKSGGGMEITLRDFLVAASSEGMQPVMAAIESATTPAIKQSLGQGMGQGGKEDGIQAQTFRLTGTAIFKDFKLAGYLDDAETRGLLWINGKLKQGILTAYVPEGGGLVSLNLTKAERRIKPEIRGDKVKIGIELQGEGVIHENNTNLDLSQPENLKLVEKALKKAIINRVRRTVRIAQEEYKADVFGFGQQIQRGEAKQWKSLKQQWEKKFPEAEVSVTTELTVLRTGMSGPPLQLKEDEVKKK